MGRPTTTAAGTPFNALTPTPASPEEGTRPRKASQRRQSKGGKGEWTQKWGTNNDNDEYDANDVASAAQMIQQSTRR